jgi:hypothetical protein
MFQHGLIPWFPRCDVNLGNAEAVIYTFAAIVRATYRMYRLMRTARSSH